MKPGEVITFWTIYQRPIDLHHSVFAMRRWTLDSDGEGKPSLGFLTADTLPELRDLLPPGCYPMGRTMSDDPKIIEVWMK